jgi:hypothetical protein
MPTCSASVPLCSEFSWPSRRKHDNPSKRQELLVRKHNITSQNTGIFETVFILHHFHWREGEIKLDLKQIVEHRWPLTNSMEKSPSWKANRSSAGQEIPRILWNSKVYYHFHKVPPPASIHSHSHPVHTSPSHFLKIHFNIIRQFLWGIRAGLRSVSSVPYKIFYGISMQKGGERILSRVTQSRNK